MGGRFIYGGWYETRVLGIRDLASVGSLARVAVEKLFRSGCDIWHLVVAYSKLFTAFRFIRTCLGLFIFYVSRS